MAEPEKVPPVSYQQPGAQPQYQPTAQYQQPVAGGPPGQPQFGAAAGMQWMPPVQQVPVGCPRGLEYLTQLDQLIVKQQIELLEVFTGWETNNKYRILNSVGQDVYFAVEDNDCCNRQCCGPARSFNMKVLDNYQQEIISLWRPLKCQACCCWCCLQEMEIRSGGEICGYVEQKWSLWDYKFDLMDAQRNTVLKIRGPCCVIPCCVDVNFQLLALDETTQVGEIIRQFTGCGQECWTDASNFSITFPMDLDVKMKAVVFGATMLLDFMFFEHQNNNN